MALIHLSRGLVAIVDDADIPLLTDRSWYATPAAGHMYAYSRVPGPRTVNKKVSMHRLLMGEPSGMVVHHLNNDGLDNRRANLAVVNQFTNIAAHYHSKRTGAYFDKDLGRFRAMTRVDGIRHDLGLFDDREEALDAVAAARRKYRIRSIPQPG